MSFDIEEIQRENKRKWLAKMKKSDPHYARLFCDRCMEYTGAARSCDCDQNDSE